MGIAHGHFDILMTKQAADQRQRGSRLYKPGGKGMAKGMEADTLPAIGNARVKTAGSYSLAENMVGLLRQAAPILKKGEIWP